LKTQVSDLFLAKDTLGELEIEASFLKMLKDFIQILEVLFPGWRINTCVIYINTHITPGEVTKNQGHKPLICSRRIDQAHRHACILEETEASNEGRLLTGIRGKGHCMEAGGAVQDTEIPGSLKAAQQVLGARKGKSILLGDRIETASIIARSQTIIWLLNENHVGSPRRIGWSDNTQIQES